MGDFEKLLEAVWRALYSPQILYLGSKTPKHSVICDSSTERVDFHHNPPGGADDGENLGPAGLAPKSRHFRENDGIS